MEFLDEFFSIVFRKFFDTFYDKISTVYSPVLHFQHACTLKMRFLASIF